MDDAVDVKKLAEDDADYKEDEEVEDEKPQRGVVTAESDKLKQLNLLLDKARIYSQFISQQLQASNTPKEDVKEEPVKEEEAATKRRGRRPKNQKKNQSLQEKLEELPEKPAESLVRTVQPELVTGGKMRDYQLFGINWLIQLFENGMNGILADEMGLGKTIQTVSFLAHLWGKGITGPFLVVAPLSTLRNWANEFQKWTPSLPVVMYHGSKAERETLRGEITRAKKADGARPKIPIIITSYNIAMNDKRFLQCFHWKYLVVDEAHRLKNFNCRLIRELRALRTENRLLLTGTPLQNSLTELWSLLNFILPDIFDSLENFQSWFDFDEVIIKGETEGKSVEENKESISEQLVQKLHNILQPFLLRRLKHDVELSLPKKREYVLYCPFKPAQKAFYNLLKQHDWKKIVAGTSGKMKLLNILMHLRKVCNHPFLFDDDFDSFYKKYKNNQIEVDEPEEKPVQVKAAEETNGSGKKKRKRRGQVEEIADLPESRLRKKRRLNYDEIALFKKLEEEDEMEVEDQPEDESETEPKTKELVMPKRGKSAWMIYFVEQRKEAAKKNPGASMSELFKICSTKWKALSDKERETYVEKAREDKRRYFAEVQTTLAEHNPSLVIEDPDKYLEDLKETCGKIELTEKMLKILLPNGHKTLIFSQMTRLLDILEDFLEYSGYSYCRIDGSTAQTDRQEQIELFNNDPNVSVFLLSTRAGGLGINLTAADSVIIYDSDWNPQMDMQAQDRCHRIGQTKPVCVYRLITANSVDSWILQRANAKLKLERLVIHKEKFKGDYNDGQSNAMFSENEMLDLLKSDATELGEDHVIADKDLERVCLDRKSLLNNKQGGFELIETVDGQSRLTVTK